MSVKSLADFGTGSNSEDYEMFKLWVCSTILFVLQIPIYTGAYALRGIIGVEHVAEMGLLTVFICYVPGLLVFWVLREVFSPDSLFGSSRAHQEKIIGYTAFASAAGMFVLPWLTLGISGALAARDEWGDDKESVVPYILTTLPLGAGPLIGGAILLFRSSKRKRSLAVC